jgi:aryl-alcohol dehydrogenase-like predicted oxidoreductase
VAFLRNLGRSGIEMSALAWLWARSQQILLIPGFHTVQQVAENCGALLPGKLAGDQMQEIETLFERT